MILAVPVGLILLEPDVGQSITYFPILAVILFLSAVKIRYVILTILAIAIMMPVGYWVGVQTGKIKKVIKKERIDVIIDPEGADPRGYAYHYDFNQ